MLSATKAYKQAMDKPYRNHSYVMVTIGVINQVAQKRAYIGSVGGEAYSYLSNKLLLFDSYDPDAFYVTMEQNCFSADGMMYFPPESSDEFLLNQGVISYGILGAICIRFDAAYDIKGLTIDFGRIYPVDFTVTNGSVTRSYTGNEKSYWTTDDIFNGSSYLTITPTAMSQGQDRLRILKVYMGVGIQFDNSKLTKVEKREYLSQIMEELPTLDMNMTADNHDKLFNVNNEGSSINYFEQGQEVTTVAAYELDDGSLYLMDLCKTNLKTWSADDKTLKISTVDKIAGLDSTFYGGLYRSGGITLYDLAVEVFADAGVDTRDYELDSYLKKVTVYNPLPCSSHKECLQLIANAGRCKLYQKRDGVIAIKAAFTMDISPDRMLVTSGDATDYSNLMSVVTGAVQYDYADMTQNYFAADGSMYFLPEDSGYLVAGFVSDAVASSTGTFAVNPKITIKLEAAQVYYSLTVNFAANQPQEMVLHSYLDGELRESYKVSALELENTIDHEFPEFDTLVLEFTKGMANNRVHLDTVSFGDVTDYALARHWTLKETPTGEKDDKIAEVQVEKYSYTNGTELQNIATEKIDVTNTATYTFYFSEASHNVTVKCDGTALTILASSSYMVKVDVSAYSGTHEFTVNGYQYMVISSIYTNTLDTTGDTVTWSNPLISTNEMAQLQAKWLGSYYDNNVNYSIKYRGEPRLDAGDLAFMEDDVLDNLMVQIGEHDLTFSGGALSGTIKARRARGGI